MDKSYRLTWITRGDILFSLRKQSFEEYPEALKSE